MSENQTLKTPFQIGLYHGVLLSVISIVISLLMLFVPESALKSILFMVASGIFSLVISCSILYAAITVHKKQQGGFVSFGQGFNVSAWTSFINCTIGTVWFYVFYYIINPNYFKNAKQEAIMQLETQNLSEENMEMQLKIMDIMFSSYVMIPTTFIFSMIFSIILGLIMSAILKKEKENPFD